MSLDEELPPSPADGIILPPSVVIPTVEEPIKNEPAGLTAENLIVDRADVVELLRAAPTQTQVFEWLKSKKLTAHEAEKVLSDLDSYK